MNNMLFKGIKQVTMDFFNDIEDKKGYLWFVREIVQKQEGNQSPFEENRYHIYFGDKKYGDFWGGLYESIGALVEAIKQQSIEISNKQEIINDLEIIRANAAKGATALQSYTEQYQGTIIAVDTGDEIDDVETNTYVKYVAQELEAEQQTQARNNIGAFTSYEYYKNHGGTLSEAPYNVMIKYLFTPFMVSRNSVTTIPDDLLNESKTMFVTEYYWNIMRITGGEPFVTVQWNGNIPYKFKGILNNEIFVIDFINKTIIPESL